MRKIIFLIPVALLLSWPSASMAQSKYPVREIEFIVPFPPGGPGDTAARIIQPRLSAMLDVPLVITNKTGGGGAVGADFVAKSKPDGYRVFATTNAPLTITTATQSSLPYRMEDFAAVGSYMADLGVIASRAGTPWKTLEELVQFAKKNPGKLSYGSAGVGTVSHFTMEIFKLSYGLDIAHVPFQGTGPVKNALLGGHVQIGVSGLASLGQLIRTKDFVALVTTAPRRLPEYPNVPTFSEKGFPDASLNIWMGLFVPAKTPQAIIDTLAKALERTMKDPSVNSAVAKAGMVADYRDPAATRKLVESEHQAVMRVVQKLGMRN